MQSITVHNKTINKKFNYNVYIFLYSKKNGRYVTHKKTINTQFKKKKWSVGLGQ